MVSTSLEHHLREIADHHEILECPSPIHLGAFLYGYALLVPKVSWLGDALNGRFAGPVQASVWTRAYLTFGNDLGMRRLIDAAIQLLNTPTCPAITSDSGVPEMFVNVILDAVRKQRPATVLGETTIPWLYNFGLGAQAAATDFFPASAIEWRAALLNFQIWLQRYFDAPDVPWQRILRAFEGPGEKAVYQFARLWNEHLRE